MSSWKFCLLCYKVIFIIELYIKIVQVKFIRKYVYYRVIFIEKLKRSTISVCNVLNIDKKPDRVYLLGSLK